MNDNIKIFYLCNKDYKIRHKRCNGFGCYSNELGGCNHTREIKDALHKENRYYLKIADNEYWEIEKEEFVNYKGEIDLKLLEKLSEKFVLKNIDNVSVCEEIEEGKIKSIYDFLNINVNKIY